MSARVSIEELRPAGERRAAERALVRRRFQGARVLSEGMKLEPRDAGGILDLAIDGLLARLGPSLAVALLLWLPFRQVAELLGLSGMSGFEQSLASLAWNTLGLVPIGVTTSVVVSLVGEALIDRRTPLAAGLLRGLARAPGAVALLLVTQILTLPLVVLCVVPYFLVQWVTWAAIPIYVLEGEALLTPNERARGRRSLAAWLANAPRGVLRALRRSLSLSSGAPAFWRWVLLAVVGQLVLGGMLELGATGLTQPEAREYVRSELGFSGAAAEFGLGAVAALFSSLSSCLRAALMVAFYLDLRVRREGWDLELVLARAPRPASTDDPRAAEAR